MRILFTILILSYAPLLLAKTPLHKDCSSLEGVSKSGFILFRKKELIELGQCVGVALLKENKIDKLPQNCSELIEDNSAPLGYLSLSKREAIEIGQCIGVINHIYQLYNDKTNRYDYSGKTYHCKKNIEAAEIISSQSNRYKTVKEMSKLLCEYY